MYLYQSIKKSASIIEQPNIFRNKIELSRKDNPKRFQRRDDLNFRFGPIPVSQVGRLYYIYIMRKRSHIDY